MNCYFCNSKLSFDYDVNRTVWDCPICQEVFFNCLFSRYSYTTMFSVDEKDNIITSKLMIFEISGINIFVLSSRKNGMIHVGTEKNITNEPLIINHYSNSNEEFAGLANRYHKMLPFS